MHDHPSPCIVLCCRDLQLCWLWLPGQCSIHKVCLTAGGSGPRRAACVLQEHIMANLSPAIAPTPHPPLPVCSPTSQVPVDVCIMPIRSPQHLLHHFACRMRRVDDSPIHHLMSFPKPHRA